MSATKNPARARLEAAIERRAKLRGRPLTAREQLQNLAIALRRQKDSLLPEEMRGLPDEPLPN